MTRQAFVHRVAMRAPDDVSGLEAAIAAGAIDPDVDRRHFRQDGGQWLRQRFLARSRGSRVAGHAPPARPGDAGEAVKLVMSGGTEGALSPHFVVFEARDVAAPPESGALAVGHARTAPLPFESLGRLRQVDDVADGRTRRDGGCGPQLPGDVHFVQIKCPLLTADRVAEVEARGLTTATRDSLKSMCLSRAASALGVAVALGEVDRARITDEFDRPRLVAVLLARFGFRRRGTRRSRNRRARRRDRLDRTVANSPIA